MGKLGQKSTTDFKSYKKSLHKNNGKLIVHFFVHLLVLYISSIRVCVCVLHIYTTIIPDTSSLL